MRGIPAGKTKEHREFQKGVENRIRKILMKDWNPIGISDLPKDEYDSYIPTLHFLLDAGFRRKQIAKLLHWLADEHMGCPLKKKKSREIADKLLAIPIKNPFEEKLRPCPGPRCPSSEKAKRRRLPRKAPRVKSG